MKVVLVADTDPIWYVKAGQLARRYLEEWLPQGQGGPRPRNSIIIETGEEGGIFLSTFVPKATFYVYGTASRVTVKQMSE